MIFLVFLPFLFQKCADWGSTFVVYMFFFIIFHVLAVQKLLAFVCKYLFDFVVQFPFFFRQLLFNFHEWNPAKFRNACVFPVIIQWSHVICFDIFHCHTFMCTCSCIQFSTLRECMILEKTKALRRDDKFVIVKRTDTPRDVVVVVELPSLRELLGYD